MNEAIKSILGETNYAQIEAIGWMFAEACNLMDKGIDIRAVDQAEVLAKALHELRNQNDEL